MTSLFVVNPESDTPIYRQLIDQVRRLIEGGFLQHGDTLPSVREVAMDCHVNPTTVSKAYGGLEREGLIVHRRGKPMTVAERRRNSHSRSHAMLDLERQIQSLWFAAHQLQVSGEQLMRLVANQVGKSTLTATARRQV